MTWPATWKDNDIIIPWPDAAERLRYREGAPWCNVMQGFRDWFPIVCKSRKENANELLFPLHRLAAILCDDAEAFRVLHWCVTEMGGQDEK
jgi:hypothetical protein